MRTILSFLFMLGGSFFCSCADEGHMHLPDGWLPVEDEALVGSRDCTDIVHLTRGKTTEEECEACQGRDHVPNSNPNCLGGAITRHGDARIFYQICAFSQGCEDFLHASCSCFWEDCWEGNLGICQPYAE